MKRIILMFAVALLAALPQALLACPNCKEAYIDGGGSVSSGYNTSILFMMIIPFVVMGIVFVRIAVSMRKKRALDELGLHQN